MVLKCTVWNAWWVKEPCQIKRCGTTHSAEKLRFGKIQCRNVALPKIPSANLKLLLTIGTSNLILQEINWSSHEEHNYAGNLYWKLDCTTWSTSPKHYLPCNNSNRWEESDSETMYIKWSILCRIWTTDTCLNIDILHQQYVRHMAAFEC